MGALSYVRTQGGGSFEVAFNRCERKPGTFKEELYATARSIAAKATKPLVLCMSGGADSEIMARAFFEQGIHFSALTLEHSAGTNMFDVQNARTWCWSRNIPHSVVPLDLEKFFGADIGRYVAEGYRASSIQKYLQLKLLETVESHGGYAVIGCGIPLYAINPSQTDPAAHLVFPADHELPYEWCVRHKVSHEPYFFLHSPEMYLSYTTDPILAFILGRASLLRNPDTIFSARNIVYQSYWPDFRARRFLTGFERHKKRIKKVLRQMEPPAESAAPGFLLALPDILAQLSPR